MRALELNAIFNKPNHAKTLERHRERMNSVKKSIDNKVDGNVLKLIYSPRKQGLKDEKNGKIARENLVLAKKIFNIMEGESPIAQVINDTKHLDTHPGTMNFHSRLSEAQRIHTDNMLLAARLETVQPTFKKSDLCFSMKRNKKKKNKAKTVFGKELESAFGGAGGRNRGKTAPVMTSRTDNDYDYQYSGNNRKGLLLSQPNTARPQKSHMDEASSSSSSKDGSSSDKNVLLEYTKVQNGRVLDIVVIKEPFRDRYAIFGIDIDSAQRYDLRLSSADVSNILDGDILVTSLDKVEVWMALLNKVQLNPVESFNMPQQGDHGMTHAASNDDPLIEYDQSQRSQQSNPYGDQRYPQFEGSEQYPGYALIDRAGALAEPPGTPPPGMMPARPTESRPSASKGGSRGVRGRREEAEGAGGGMVSGCEFDMWGTQELDGSDHNNSITVNDTDILIGNSNNHNSNSNEGRENPPYDDPYFFLASPSPASYPVSTRPDAPVVPPLSLRALDNGSPSQLQSHQPQQHDTPTRPTQDTTRKTNINKGGRKLKQKTQPKPPQQPPSRVPLSGRRVMNNTSTTEKQRNGSTPSPRVGVVKKATKVTRKKKGKEKKPLTDYIPDTTDHIQSADGTEQYDYSNEQYDEPSHSSNDAQADNVTSKSMDMENRDRLVEKAVDEFSRTVQNSAEAAIESANTGMEYSIASPREGTEEGVEGVGEALF